MRTVHNVRFSIYELQRLYDNGYKKPLEDVCRAFKGVMELPAEDKRSFFMIGGYHGEPFIVRHGEEEKKYWGGYCHHGNVLFPTWHRAYLIDLEKSMQSIVPDVTLPFFDATHPDAYENGLPDCITRKTIVLDGEEIPNPLYSFTLPDQINDDFYTGARPDYTKPKDYETVRYPYSGLVGTPEDVKETEEHNKQWNHEEAVAELNKNFKAWLRGRIPTPDYPDPTENGVMFQFMQCLKAPNYTVFSNKTSAEDYSAKNPGTYWSLEQPHNDVHLAIGGYWYDNGVELKERGQIVNANGDMGENNTAGLDPVFYLHHCNVDRMFWMWQELNGCTDELPLDTSIAGTNSDAAFGPPAGIDFNVELTMDTPLYPFKKDGGADLTSKDIINIETQCGYTYGAGSLELFKKVREIEMIPRRNVPVAQRKLHIYGITKNKFEGSFIIYAFCLLEDGSKEYLGHHSQLNRNNTEGCANCQNFMQVGAMYPLTVKALAFYNKYKNLMVQVIYAARDPETRRRAHIEAEPGSFRYEIIA